MDNSLKVLCIALLTSTHQRELKHTLEPICKKLSDSCLFYMLDYSNIEEWQSDIINKILTFRT